MRESKILIIL